MRPLTASDLARGAAQARMSVMAFAVCAVAAGRIGPDLWLPLFDRRHQLTTLASAARASARAFALFTVVS